MHFLVSPGQALCVVRVGGDDGDLRPLHYIYLHSIESRLIMRVRYEVRHLICRNPQISLRYFIPWVLPHGGVRPFHQTPICLTQWNSGPYVVQIWSRTDPDYGVNENFVLHCVGLCPFGSFAKSIWSVHQHCAVFQNSAMQHLRFSCTETPQKGLCNSR